MVGHAKTDLVHPVKKITADNLLSALQPGTILCKAADIMDTREEQARSDIQGSDSPSLAPKSSIRSRTATTPQKPQKKNSKKGASSHTFRKIKHLEFAEHVKAGM